ncbi:type II 3-dehydroquinate dehydratase [bacterium]|nr:type II 3-dehydroquinate dehydratase [bacterium]
MNPSIYCLNGPNLNLLGQREPEIYGRATLDDVAEICRAECDRLGFLLEFRQTNHEGVLIDWVQESRGGAALVINAGGYTHTSVALHDALRTLTIPIIEVHLSNPSAREAFRGTNFVAPAASGSISGFGAFGYHIAIQAAAQLCRRVE